MKGGLIAALAVPAGLALLLGIEAVLAVTAERLPERDPFDLDGSTGDGADPLRMIWIGDSVSAGVGASGPEAALPRLVAAEIGRPVEVQVLAVSGHRVEDAVAEQVPRLRGLAPGADVVVVEIGANDVTHLTSRLAFARAYDRLLRGVEATEPRRILALGIPAFGTTPRFLQPLRAIAGWRGRRLDEVVRGLARAHGAAYVDIAAETGPAFAADPEGMYAADRFHPSDAGYRSWADAVLPVLLPLMRG